MKSCIIFALKYYYIDQSRMGWAENVARVGDMRNVYKILVETPERKRTL